MRGSLIIDILNNLCSIDIDSNILEHCLFRVEVTKAALFFLSNVFFEKNKN